MSRCIARSMFIDKKGYFHPRRLMEKKYFEHVIVSIVAHVSNATSFFGSLFMPNGIWTLAPSPSPRPLYTHTTTFSKHAQPNRTLS